MIKPRLGSKNISQHKIMPYSMKQLTSSNRNKIDATARTWRLNLNSKYCNKTKTQFVSCSEKNMVIRYRINQIKRQLMPIKTDCISIVTICDVTANCLYIFIKSFTVFFETARKLLAGCYRGTNMDTLLGCCSIV